MKSEDDKENYIDYSPYCGDCGNRLSVLYR